MKKNLKHIARFAAVAGLGASMALGAAPVVVIADEVNPAAGDVAIDNKSGANETQTGSDSLVASQKVAEDANQGGDVDVITHVAEVAGKKYASVSDAVKDAPENATIALVADVKENVEVLEGKNITLDLAGHTLSGGTVAGEAAITNKGTLTVKDSSAEGTGRIIREDNGASGYYTILNKGTMTIRSGSVYNKTGVMPKGSSLICNLGTKDKPATLNIEGGNIKQDGFIAVKNDDYGVLNITGGTIATTGDTDEYTASAVQNWSDATISSGVINGAVWTSTWSPEMPASNTVITGDAKVTGSIILKKHAAEAIAPALKIAGGILKVDKWSVAEKDVTIEVSGGTFTGEPPAKDYIASGSGLTQNPDGTFDVHNHVGKKVDAVAATCTTPGMKEHWACTDCDKLFSDANLKNEVAKADLEIAATGHDATTAKHHKRVEPTYEADGNIEYWECAACGTLFSDAKLTKGIAQADTVLPKLVPHKVTFVNAFADDVVVEVKDGETVARPADPTHENWEFMGWYITLNDDGTLKDEYDFATPVEGDLLLYAGWVKKDVDEPQQPVADNTAKPGSTLPKTGDASMLPMIAAAGAGVSAIALGAVARRRQK